MIVFKKCCFQSGWKIGYFSVHSDQIESAISQVTEITYIDIIKKITYKTVVFSLLPSSIVSLNFFSKTAQCLLKQINVDFQPLITGFVLC